MGGATVRIENLTRDFGLVRAVDDLSLEVATGIIDYAIDRLES